MENANLFFEMMSEIKKLRAELEEMKNVYATVAHVQEIVEKEVENIDLANVVEEYMNNEVDVEGVVDDYMRNFDTSDIVEEVISEIAKKLK